MPDNECPGLTPAQERMIMTAVEGNCELCREYFAFPFLEVHRISRRRYREMVRDPSTRILVVCRLCHDHIHRLPIRVKDQRAVAARRSFYVRQDLRSALGYRPKPYFAPDEPDPSRLYEEMFSHIAPGSFRLSG